MMAKVTYKVGRSTKVELIAIDKLSVVAAAKALLISLIKQY